MAHSTQVVLVERKFSFVFVGLPDKLYWYILSWYSANNQSIFPPHQMKEL